MSEYVGSETFVALQKALHARHDEIACNPLVSNGGRIMNILDPDAFGWDNVRRVAEEDRFVGLTMVDQKATLARLDEVFGDAADFPYWDVFTGTPQDVLKTCDHIIDTVALPKRWHSQSFIHPDEDTIERVQALNMMVGVAPVPAYYLRGKVLPSMLTCLYDELDNIVACASGVMRYHADSTLAGWIFAGGVAVDPNHRKKGLGTLVNATLLRESHRTFGWRMALEQAKHDNLPSVGMIKNCGLSPVSGKVTIVINLTGGTITR